MPPFSLPIRRETSRRFHLKQLLMGASITEAAQAAGVTRQTVSEWCNHTVEPWDCP
jgi:transposase